MFNEYIFSDEEAELLLDLVGKTRKANGSRKYELCKDIADRFLHSSPVPVLNLTDVVSGKRWSLDFTWFCFPGMKNEGFRIEGFCKTGLTNDGYPSGDACEFGSLILSDGVAKIVQW